MEHCPKEKWEATEEVVKEEMSQYEVAPDCETWRKTECPACAAMNWIFMAIDLEACECFNCQETFWISDDIYEEYKTCLIMAKVFDYKSKSSEDIFMGMEKPN